VDEITATHVVGHLQLGPAHHTAWGIVHGGVYATAGRVTVTAVALHQGRTQQLWQVDITDGDGRLIAYGNLRLQNINTQTIGTRLAVWMFTGTTWWPRQAAVLDYPGRLG
jgi:acyl-coenzyme A thioesterase PaaI-like protein